MLIYSNGCLLLLCPRPRVGSLSDDARLTSVYMSVAYIWPKSTTERPRKTKIGTHKGSPRHTWLGHHFQGQKVKGQGLQTALLTAALTRQAAAAVTGGTYCPWEPTATLRSAGAVGSAARGASAPRGRRGRGILWRPPAYSLLYIFICGQDLCFLSFFYYAAVNVVFVQWRSSKPCTSTADVH